MTDESPCNEKCKHCGSETNYVGFTVTECLNWSCEANGPRTWASDEFIEKELDIIDQEVKDAFQESHETSMERLRNPCADVEIPKKSCVPQVNCLLICDRWKNHVYWLCDDGHAWGWLPTTGWRQIIHQKKCDYSDLRIPTNIEINDIQLHNCNTPIRGTGPSVAWRNGKCTGCGTKTSPVDWCCGECRGNHQDIHYCVRCNVSPLYGKQTTCCQCVGAQSVDPAGLRRTSKPCGEENAVCGSCSETFIIPLGYYDDDYLRCPYCDISNTQRMHMENFEKEGRKAAKQHRNFDRRMGLLGRQVDEKTKYETNRSER
jgi:hypothetical protein